MASHEDLILIIKQLLKSMEKMGDCLSVVKSIGENVKGIDEEVELIKDRLQSIEERVSGDHLPTKAEVLSMKKVIDTKLTPLDKVNAMDIRLGRIEERISNLRSIDETPTKSDLLSIKETLDQKMNPLHQIEVIDVRISRLERSIATVSMESANPPIRFDSTKKGRNELLTNDGMCAERLRPLENNGFYGGVISDVPLLEDNIFQIRIEETIDRWSAVGIPIGVIRDKEEAEVEGATSIIGKKGTWAIFSHYDTTPGTSDIWKDNKIITPNGYPLETRRLKVGTILGIKHCSNGDLRFFLNGEDKGVAFRNVPKNVHAFVDIMYYVTKISVVK